MQCSARQVLEYLAAEGIVEAAVLVIQQDLIQFEIAEQAEAEGIDTQLWNEMLDRLRELLGLTQDEVLRFLTCLEKNVTTTGQPPSGRRLAKAFFEAWEQSGGPFKKHDGAEVIRRALKLFMEEAE
jgi:hypothetical protein